MKTLKINSCLQCPHHGVERDPSSGDSFDWQDDALVCYKARGKFTQTKSNLGGYVWKGEARIIIGASRSAVFEYKNRKLGIPDWCPL
jgi:hypothetical protein